jgi:hypothetical protein
VLRFFADIDPRYIMITPPPGPSQPATEARVVDRPGTGRRTRGDGRGRSLPSERAVLVTGSTGHRRSCGQEPTLVTEIRARLRLKILFSVPRSAASSTISPEIKASSGWALLIMSPSNHSDQ